MSNLNSRGAAGDRIFVSSDHSETSTTSPVTYYSNGSAPAFGLQQIISVNRAGSVPPVPADITNGAAITLALASGTGNLNFEAFCNVFWQGITFTLGGASTSTQLLNFNANSTARKAHYLKNCAIVMSNTTATNAISTGAASSTKVTLDNTTIQFGATGHTIRANGPLEWNWINTPSAIAGTVPSTLFLNNAVDLALIAICRGVDLSAITGTILNSANSSVSNKVLLDSCRVASGVTAFSLGSTTGSPANDEIELVNCYDGTNVLNERHTAAGDVTTDRSTYLSGGAQDDIGNYSLKLVSASRSDFMVLTLDAFVFDVENILTGSSKTATIEIISSGSLNNNDIRLLLEYMGTSGNPVASFGDSLATILTAASALPSSSNTWNSPPATPQKQLLQVIFTPQRAGRVRGLVRLGKISTTVWVNPQVRIT